MRFFNIYRRSLSSLLVMLLLSAGVCAQTRQNLEEQRKRALQEIEETNRFLRGTLQSQKGLDEKLNLLDAQVIQYSRLINSIVAEIAYIDRQISETSVNVTRMSGEIEKMKAEYARLVFSAYKNKGQYNRLIYVLSSKDFNEAYRRMKYFQQYSDYRKKQIDEIKVRQEELNVVLEKLTVQRAEKEKLLTAHHLESSKLEIVKIEQNKEMNTLKLQERKFRNLLVTQQRKEKRLQTEIEKIIAAEAQKLSSNTNNLYDKLTPAERLIANNFKENKGRLPWPTEKGIITGFFGMNVHPLFKDIRRDNSGIDITTVSDAEVRAIFDGEVVSIGRIPGDNMFVLLRHGRYITVYKNLVDVKVKQGDKVKFKDTIGKVYTEKGVNTSLLHFEIWEEFNKLNPEQWIVKN